MDEVIWLETMVSTDLGTFKTEYVRWFVSPINSIYLFVALVDEARSCKRAGNSQVSCVPWARHNKVSAKQNSVTNHTSGIMAKKEGEGSFEDVEWNTRSTDKQFQPSNYSLSIQKPNLHI